MLLVCSSRPGLDRDVPVPLRPAGDASDRARRRCRRQATGALIANLLGDDVAPEIAARVEEAAEGNPLFIEETVRMLLDEGLIARHGSRWEPRATSPQVVLPPSIEALLAAPARPARARPSCRCSSGRP